MQLFTCTGCSQSKPAEDYYHVGGKRESRCKECRKAAQEARNRAKGVKPKPVSYIAGNLKFCLRCKTEKPLEEFSKCANGAGGLQSYCKSCSSAAIKDYYQQNKEAVNESNRQWRQSNPEKMQQYRNKWEEENPDKLKVTRIKHTAAARVARAGLEDDGSVTHEFLMGLYATENCYYCGKYTETDDRSQDHKVARSDGGPHTSSNLVMACISCNARKHAMSEEEFRLKLARENQ